MKGSEAVYGVEPNRRNRGLGDDGPEASPSAVAPCGHERALDRQSGVSRVQRAQECVHKMMCVWTVTEGSFQRLRHSRPRMKS